MTERKHQGSFMRPLFKALALMCTLLPPLLFAQEFPTRPIKLVVPFAAGGPADTQARWLGVKLGALLGQQVIVDNRGGAGGLLGAQAVATASADGYTLLFSSVGALAIAPYIADRVPYNPEQDLLPIVRFATAPTVLVVNAKAPYPSTAAVVAHAKTAPGRVSFASAGPGTTTHLGAELLKREAGVDMVHVPYKGAAPALNDVLGGLVDVMFADAPVVLPFIRAGRLKALAVGTPKRIAALPDVQTTAEAGYKGVLVSTWYGVLAPAKTPPAIVAKVNKAVNAVIASADGKAFFAAQGLEANGGTPEAFSGFIQSESTRWTALAKAAGVRMD